MKVKYVGRDIGVDGLINNHIYEVVRVDELTGYLSVIDERGEDYLYHPQNPRPIASAHHPGGRFEVVVDDENKSLYKAIYGY